MKAFFDEQLIFTFSDMQRVFWRYWNPIKKVAMSLAVMTFCFLLLREPVYEMEATFKQGPKQPELGVNMKEIFQQFMSLSTEGGTMAVMQSKTVLRNVIDELGLQVACNSPSWLGKGLTRIWENLFCECGGNLSDLDTFCFRQVTYVGEKTLSLFVALTDSNIYALYDAKKHLLAKGKLGEPLNFPGGSLTLKRPAKNAKNDYFYPLKIHPWEGIVKKLQKKLRVIPLKQDKNILKLTFYSRDRFLGAEFLNRLMLGYQNYLKWENDDMCQKQLAHLQKRQDELTKNYDLALLEHVGYLKENLSSNGFIGFAQEVETLSQPKNFYTSKLFDVDLELKRLHDVQKNKKNSQAIKKKEKPDPLLLEKNQLISQIENCDFSLKKMPKDSSITEIDSFSAFGLETAQGLLVEYTRERDSLQAQILEIGYLRDQILKPNFEMSSLGGVFEDSVTRELVSKSSSIALQLKDESNRSLREQERLQETLQTQKNFLSHYLLQIVELKQLHLKLLDNKIATLQNTTHSLLESEKELLKDKLGELNDKMADLPEKWRRESLLLLKKEFGAMMLEGVSQLAEAKYLGQHIFQINSKPLDKAFPPLSPQSPRLFIFSLLAALFGSAGAFFFFFCKTLLKGMPASDMTLRLSGFDVSGLLSSHFVLGLTHMSPRDLETLRTAAEKIAAKLPTVAACIGGKYVNYSEALAELLCMRGLKVLLVQAAFDQATECKGLWHFLQGEINELPIKKKNSLDFIPSGKISQHAAEILSSVHFPRFLTDVKQKYDIIILYTSAHAASTEGKCLLKWADIALVTAQQETLEELSFYRYWAEQNINTRVSLIYAEEK